LKGIEFRENSARERSRGKVMKIGGEVGVKGRDGRGGMTKGMTK
jgi:hypothetical protein